MSMSPEQPAWGPRGMGIEWPFPAAWEGLDLQADSQLPDLSDYASFCLHPWVQQAMHKYEASQNYYAVASRLIVNHLWEINQEYADTRNGQSLFTAVDARVKHPDSFKRKLYCLLHDAAKSGGLSAATFQRGLRRIHDVVGARFSVPYMDHVESVITKVIRPELHKRHYATDLSTEDGLADKNYLDNGTDDGYRSYHFFVKIPITYDLFGNSQLCLCEIQGRSELQHVWAVKSHDLFYKPDQGWVPTDSRTKDDMLSISDMLKQIDRMLLNIRDRVRGDA